MEALTPREIQQRIRSGQSVADLVKVAGTNADRVEAFAAPVLAEREHIAALALASPVRRAGEPGSSRRLRQVVAERLLSRGLDIDLVEWDAWRRSDGRWIAQANYQAGGEAHVARFVFDSQAKFSVAEDDEARWLIGEPGPSYGPLAGRRRADMEPTVELAVTVPSPASPPPSSSPPTPGLTDHWFEWERSSHSITPSDWIDLPPPRTPLLTVLDDEDSEDTLEPGHASSLDSLYDMISVIEEDSVKIYRGLRQPLPDGDITPAAPPPASPTPDQDRDKVVPLAPPSKRRSTKRARASVPSWDEILFGSPPSAS